VKPYTLFVAVIIFGLVAAAFGVALGNTATRYYVNEDDFSDRYNYIKNVSIITVDIHDSTQEKGSTAEGGSADTEDSETGIIRGSWSVIKQIPQIWKYVNVLLYETAREFNIPDFVVTGVYAIIVIGVAFALLSAVFKWGL